MPHTLAEYIDFVKPWVPPALVSDDSLRAVHAIAETLPVLSFGCFECWLGADAPRVDFNISATGKINEHHALCAWQTVPAGFDPVTDRISWDRVQAFCRDWSAPGFALRELIDDLWLVYDLPDPIHPPAAPWLYIRFELTPLLEDKALRTEVALQTLSRIQANYSAAHLHFFRRFFLSLPLWVQISAIGIQTTRPGQLLRVYLIVQNYPDLLRLLKVIQWPGTLEKIAPWTATADTYGVALDLDLELRPTIGIECWFAEHRAQAELEQMTDDLCQRGLCTPSKQAALLAWTGRFEVDTPADLWSWPAPLQPLRPSRVTIKRIARYIKLVCAPDKPLLAKTYLYFDRLLS